MKNILQTIVLALSVLFFIVVGDSLLLDSLNIQNQTFPIFDYFIMRFGVSVIITVASLR